jgi:hypothetical protein
MYRFHVMLHVQPKNASAGPAWTRAGQSLATLAHDPTQASEPFAVSFEEVAAALEPLPGMFLEPDGALVWRSRPSVAPAWQVDGVLYDRQGRLAYIEARGSCPAAEFDRLLSAIGWPRTPVMIQLAREAVFLDIDEFRRYATAQVD